MMVQLTYGKMCHYVDIDDVVGIRHSLQSVREVLLRGGHAVMMDDTPDNMIKLIDPPSTLMKEVNVTSDTLSVTVSSFGTDTLEDGGQVK